METYPYFDRETTCRFRSREYETLGTIAPDDREYKPQMNWKVWATVTLVIPGLFYIFVNREVIRDFITTRLRL